MDYKESKNEKYQTWLESVASSSTHEYVCT